MGYGINEEYEGELNLKDLLYYVLFKWRIVILGAVIVAAIFGVYKFVSYRNTNIELYESISKGTARQEDYPEEYIEAEKSITEKELEIREKKGLIAKAKGEILNAKTYIDRSEERKENANKKILNLNDEKRIILKNIEEINKTENFCKIFDLDPNMIPTCKVTYQIGYDGYTGQDLYRDPVDSIVATLSIDLLSEVDTGKLSQKYGIPDTYLSNYYCVATDLEANTITIEAYGDNQDMAKDIFCIVKEAFDARKKIIDQGSYPIIAQQVTSYEGQTKSEQIVDNSKSLLDQRSTHNSRLKQIEEELIALETSGTDIDRNCLINETSIENYHKDIETYESDIKDISKGITYLEKEKEKSLFNTSNILKKSIKFALIGFLAGAFVVGIFFALKYLMSNKLHDTNDITQAYGLPVLAVYNEKKPAKTSKIDLWLYEQKNKHKLETDQDITMSLCAKLEYLLKDRKDLTICSSCKLERADALMSSLHQKMPNRTFKSIYLPLSSDATNLLGKAETVLMYEERDESYIDGITEEVRQFMLMKKIVVGCVVG